MERSLSVLLPVRDAQATLSATVHEILEVIPELTSRFELIVVDDGSDDATLEVADELASRYPQLRAVRHADPLGHCASIRTGLQHSTGDVIFLSDPGARLALDEVYKLWLAIEEHPFVLGRSSITQHAGRWTGWKRRGGEETLRMIDRRAVEAIQQSLDAQAQLIASLSEQGDKWFEIELRDRCIHRDHGPIGAHGTSRPTRPGGPTTPQEINAESLGRPKYLGTVKDFALGE